jgi:hypothetical protein
MLRSYFAVEPPDDEGAVRDKVARRLLALGEADPDVLSPVLSLLDVPVDEASWARREPRERRALTIDAVKRLFRRASDERPLLLVCEDLHWTDGETQAVLDALVDCVPTARFILLVTFRPHYEHEWGRKPWFRPLRITPLGPEHATALLERLLGRDSGLRVLERLWMAWLGEAHLLAGRPAEANDVATRALEVAREQHARGAEATVRHLLGEIASSAGAPDVAGANAHYGSALTLAEEIGMQPLVAHCHTGLARLCRKIGDPRAADAHFGTAAALYRAMGMRTGWSSRGNMGAASWSDEDSPLEESGRCLQPAR